jgi:hypothetical protein
MPAVVLSVCIVADPVTGCPSDAAPPATRAGLTQQRAFKPSKFVLPIGKNPSDLLSKSRTNGERMWV